MRKRIGEGRAAFPDARVASARRRFPALGRGQVSLTTMSSSVLLQTFMRKAACDNWV
jgi:hypothetical protein